MISRPSRAPVITIDGFSGAAGVTALEGSDATDHPAPESAFTVKVYAVPFDRPSTVQVRVDVMHVPPPGEDVTR